MTHRTFLRLAAAALALALALASGAGARAQGAPSLSINQVDTSAYPQVRAVISVLDENGAPVVKLAADKFQAFEGGRQLTVADLTSALDGSVPIGVVVAVDISGSMAGDALAQEKGAATAFVRQFAAGDRETVIAFHDRVVTAVPFTNDQVLLTNGFANLQASGGRALYEAVEASAFAARSVALPRRAIVLLTGGANDAGRPASTRDGSIASARAAGVPVFAIGFGDQPDAAYLRQLADATGGAYVRATAATVGAAYAQIAALLRNQYVVTVEAKGPADGGTAQLRLRVDVANTQVSANAEYQRGAAPPTATPQPSPTRTPAAGAAGSGDGTSTVLTVVGSVLAVLAVAATGAFTVSWLRRRRVVRRQTAVTASNPVQAAAQPLPRQVGAILDAGGATETGTGRLTERTAEGERVHWLGGGPVVIGSSRRDCTIVLPEGAAVAPEHVRIWLRDGRYLLHHAGGFRRRTLVNGREADWVRLESGDELQVGPHVFTFEEGEQQPPQP